ILSGFNEILGVLLLFIAITSFIAIMMVVYYIFTKVIIENDKIMFSMNNFKKITLNLEDIKGYLVYADSIEYTIKIKFLNDLDKALHKDLDLTYWFYESKLFHRLCQLGIKKIKDKYILDDIRSVNDF